MIVQFVLPRAPRWARWRPETDEIWLFVEVLPSEAVAIMERYGLNRPGELTDGDKFLIERARMWAEYRGKEFHPELGLYEPQELLHREDGIERVTFVVSNDLKHADLEVGHHPYHQFYNGDSPWWQLKEPVEVASLEDLAGFELPAPDRMVALGTVGDYDWPNDPRPRGDGWGG